MKTIEEEIWDYIDGNSSQAERSETERKIASEEEFQVVYQELLAFQQQLDQVSTDEPSMSFNRKVMDLVSLEKPPVSLQTKTDKRIIFGIASFFLLAIVAILTYAAAKIELTASTTGLNINFSCYITPTLIRTFVFVDLILLMLYADSLLRRKRLS
jgi:anti-sigma factor RsiW